MSEDITATIFLAQECTAWRRPTLPGPCGPSTIGAGRLNGRVRDGYAWFPSAIATKRYACSRRGLHLENWIEPIGWMLSPFAFLTIG